MTSRPAGLAPAAARGALAGLAGGLAMVLTEKAEQAVTHRPSSWVPGRALGSLLGRPVPDSRDPRLLGHVMQWGSAASMGALRGVWAAVGLTGPRAHAAHTVLRLSFDQTLENASGAGAPPHTWPVREQVVDVAHKAVYSWVTGVVAERLVAPALESRRGRTSH